MASSETVSIILPLHNAAAYLEQTVHSISQQTFTDWALYIIDDHSTDGSALIAQRLANQQPQKIHYYKNDQPAGKPSVGKNVGLKLSRGKLVAFMDHDDWWTPEHLEKLVTLIRSAPDIGLVGSNGFIYSEQRQTATETYRPVKSLSESEIRLQATAGTLFLTSSCMMVQRAVLEELGPIDEQLGAADDKELTLRVIASGRYRILAEPTPTVYHRVLPSSLSNRTSAIVRASNDTELIYQRYISSPHLREEEKAALGAERWLFRKRLANYYVSLGDYTSARPIYQEIMRHHQADRTTKLFYWLVCFLPPLATALIRRKRRLAQRSL